jgi:hypothetical protein
VILEAIQFPNIDPAALTIPGFSIGDLALGPFHLRWYALAYIAGLVLGWRFMVWLIRKRQALGAGQAGDERAARRTTSCFGRRSASSSAAASATCSSTNPT